MKKIFFSGVALLLLLSIILSNNQAHAASNLLHAHIIPHSHCDPGWLKTFTEYYNDHVRNILNGVLDNLLQDPKKTFNWAEISFFQLWWNEQSYERKQLLAQLVEEGRFEFIGGGVVQNDEADSSVDVVINQITDGHDFLMRHFNTRPRIAWQVDPFGHSALTPTLFSLAGYEAMVINRIHHQLKSNYKRSRHMEFIWRASPSYGESTEMFTHVLHTHYAAPVGFDWEEGSPSISDYNLGSRANDLANALKSRSEAYQTDQLLVPWGDDFKFQNAGWQYSNMDQLVKYINEHPELGVQISYSTLSRYFDAVHESAKKNQVKFPVCDGDFFPYADNEDSYWTGYYTSRPVLKYQHREAISMLRSTEILYALTRIETKSIDASSVISWDNTYQQIQIARWDTDLMAHHDGITGTSRSRVVQDYLNRLGDAISNCQHISATTAGILLAKDPSIRPELVALTDQKVLEVDEATYAVVYQNPVAWKRTSMVTVRVNSQSVRVLDSEGSHVPSQVLPVWGRAANGAVNDEPAVDEYELVFSVEVAPLGLRTYFIQKTTEKEYLAAKSTINTYSTNPVPGVREMKQFTSGINIANTNLQINFGMDGFPEQLIHKTDNTQTSDFKVGYFEYATGRSGAYIFRSEGRQAAALDNQQKRLYVIKGPLVHQATIYVEKNELRMRLYNETDLPDAWIELTHSVVPSTNNRELVVRYATSLNTDTSFFTDNGIEMRARTASHRGNKPEADYFPVQSTAFIQDENQEFVVLTKQVQGATSDKSGSLEIMLHRALAQDDGRGLSEAMSDFLPLTTPHWLLFGNIPATERLRQRYSVFLEHPLRGYVAEVQDVAEWTDAYHTIYETILHDFPYNTHLRTFQVRDSFSDELVVRLSHLYEEGIHPVLSVETEVSLSTLFSRYKFGNTRRVALSATRDLPPDELVPKKKRYTTSGQRLALLTETDPDVREVGSKQNTEEEGVFLSKIALDLEGEKEKNEEVPQQRRRLLQIDTAGESFDVMLYPIETHTFITELGPAIELGNYVSSKYHNVTISQPSRVVKKPAGGSGSGFGKFNDPRRRNQNIAENALQYNYVGNYEIKTMLLFTILGVGLMLAVFLRLQRRRVKVSKSPV